MTDTSRAGDAAGAPRGIPPADGSSETSIDGMDLLVRAVDGGRVVVTVQGELDMLTAPQMRREVLDRLPTSTIVVLALDGVTFLGTSGLAALIELREHAQKSGAQLVLACTGPRVLRPLGIAGLHHLFDIHDTVDGALSAAL
ncbi:STAS domain-containing protein [Pseudonocardia sp. KRD291]|uniref:STAS domain-containing protein n=1 Tax=Pseudonocardia sp. KRD291 TaxID=2792007 RepID=UPI001C4A3A1D|nr:STAS domain-containing protein [Pseudonocardia sp. KRD291]MBW0102496.1 STAS domain-containing protein [Pseudonocardia sp. KRD291]